MPYLNVSEIETRLIIYSITYPNICDLITLPNTTFENRTSHAVRIGKRTNNECAGVLFIGGVHAREWGSSDILISFIGSILDAYTNNTGVSFGGRSYSADQIQTIINNLDIFIFPDVNPDGKYYSQNTDPWWRKNRSLISGSNCVGVDANRNYDFLWDYQTYMDPNAWVAVSDNPCSEIYHGNAPFSEPETQNVKWLLDNYPNIRFFIDIHSYSELFLYPFGHDQNQNNDNNMTFQNATYNGLWGINNDQYRQFILDVDEKRMRDFLCVRMNEALNNVRNKSYTIQQGFELYATTGTSESYAYSRHIVDPTKANIYSFGIEWGTEFQPDYDGEMTLIMQDVSAALFEFCLGCYIISCCFVTTAARGTHIAQDVKLLREFREQTLKQTMSGKLIFKKFFEKYANISSNIMEVMYKDPQIQEIVKWALVNPIVNYLKLAYRFPDASFKDLNEPWKSFLLEMQRDLEKWTGGCLNYVIKQGDIDINDYINERTTEDIAMEINLTLTYIYRSQKTRIQFLELLEKVNLIPLTVKKEQMEKIADKLTQFGRSKLEIKRILG